MVIQTLPEIITHRAHSLDEWKATQVWRNVERMRTAYYLSQQRLVAKTFRQQMNLVAENMQHMLTPDAAMEAALDTIESDADRWEDTYRQIYNSVGLRFADVTFAELTSKGGRGFYEIKSEPEVIDVWAIAVNERLTTTALSKVTTRLNQTTMRDLRKVLQEGVEAGHGVPEIARDLRKSYSGFIPRRARTIARTEVVSASNLGRRTAAQATGIPMMHIWQSTMDDRTRDTHKSVHRQTQELDKPFDVNGSDLMFPGDTSLNAAPEETINCRCTESYKAVRVRR